MHAEFVYVFVSVFVAVNICVFVFVAVNMFVFVFLAVNISFTFSVKYSLPKKCMFTEHCSVQSISAFAHNCNKYEFVFLLCLYFRLHLFLKFAV